MNKTRRGKLAKIAEEISGLSSQIEGLMDKERDDYDNMPESFRYGRQGDYAMYAVDAMEEGMDFLKEAAFPLLRAQE